MPQVLPRMVLTAPSLSLSVCMCVCEREIPYSFTVMTRRCQEAKWFEVVDLSVLCVRLSLLVFADFIHYWCGHY